MKKFACILVLAAFSLSACATTDRYDVFADEKTVKYPDGHAHVLVRSSPSTPVTPPRPIGWYASG